MGGVINESVFINYECEPEAPGGTKEADSYIEQNRERVKPTYRHTYHIMPPVGWMNDPNGFGEAFGKYHYFYQFHPYSAKWGPMHWGHYTSTDFIKWELQPTALAPDTMYDADGCFSGSSIVKDDKLFLLYTAVSRGKQTQAVAYSNNGVRFHKMGEVITAADLPEGCSPYDFRDPKIFRREGVYYMLVGSKAADNAGQILLYRSANFFRWEYVGIVRRDGLAVRGIYECPDIFSVNGTDVILSSPQGYMRRDWRFENAQSAIYMVGKLNTDTGAFEKEYEDEIDGGFDFYAPQTMQTSDGRIIMVAWMQMWVRSFPTAADGWVGASILPRELTLKDGKLYQAPVREVENYRKNPTFHREIPLSGETVLEGVTGTKAELNVMFDLGDAEEVGVKVFCGKKHATRIYYSRSQNCVVFDRSKMGVTLTHDCLEENASVRSVKVNVKENKLFLRIFMDVSSCEVFLNGGERTMTGNVYSEADDTGIAFYAKGGSAKIVNLEKYDIIV